MLQSRFSIGIACSRSSAFPCGTPSTTSSSTTSANSFAAIQCAAVAPTFPEPTTVTFFRISSPFSLLSFRSPAEESAFSILPELQLSLAHILDHPRCELARLCLRRSLHPALEVIRNVLLSDRLLHRSLDEPRRLSPSQKI